MNGLSPDQVTRYVGQRLLEERESRGWSHRQVQERSGGQLGAGSTGTHERGERAISLKRLAEYAAFYGVRVADLLPPERPSLVAAAFTAITAANRKQQEQMAERYEAELADLRERLAACRCDNRRSA